MAPSASFSGVFLFLMFFFSVSRSFSRVSLYTPALLALSRVHPPSSFAVVFSPLCIQGVEVVLTIWGDKAKEDDAQWQGGPVLGVKKCKVSDYNGVSLSTLGSSQLMFEPQVRRKAVQLLILCCCFCFC